MSSPSAVRRPEAVDAAGANQLAVDDLLQQLLRVVVEIPRRRADLRVVENLREAALQLPRREEELPVDERHQLVERDVDLPRCR